MKVYIQQTTSNFLYSAARGWVTNVLEADAFATSLEALTCCIQKKLTDVHIRVHCGGDGDDTIFSVADFPKHTRVPALV